MALRPKIKSPAASIAVVADEGAIAAVINRGGGPAAVINRGGGPAAVTAPAPSSALAFEADSEPQPDSEKKFTLRLPASLLAAIEKDAKGRPDRISVNTWLIGAALQRLERS